MLAIIGGTGLTQLSNLDVSRRQVVRTPYGEPSGPLTFGGIRADLGPGRIVVPHQIIDYTCGRMSTFFENEAPVKHIDFTEPYTGELRSRLLTAARTCGEAAVDGAVYAATQGPRLETAAEIDRLERDGADVVGMTGMPEATLAREIELAYAAFAVVVNHAAGRGASARGVRLQEIDEVLKDAVGRVRKIIEALVAA